MAIISFGVGISAFVGLLGSLLFVRWMGG